MATFEKRDGVDIVFINRKDFVKGAEGDGMMRSYIANFGGLCAAKVSRNKPLIELLHLPTDLEDIVIVLEEVTRQLDPFEIDAIIDHEIAHVKYNHTGNIPEDASINPVDEFELQADAYSAKKNGALVLKSALLKILHQIAKAAAPFHNAEVAAIFDHVIQVPLVVKRFQALDEMS